MIKTPQETTTEKLKRLAREAETDEYRLDARFRERLRLLTEGLPRKPRGE